MLEVAAWENAKKLFSRTLALRAGESACEQGHLVVRKREWMAKMVLGRQHVTIDFTAAGDHLVARVHESVVGVFVLVVPITATYTGWSRFPRLPE